METLPAAARLLGRSGGLAGLRFEIDSSAIIGRDRHNNVVVVSETDELVTPFARIYVKDGSKYLAPAGNARVSLDSTPVTYPVVLDRIMHVIGIDDEFEFLFTRSPAQERRESGSATTGGAIALSGETVVGDIGLGPVPDLKSAVIPKRAPAQGQPVADQTVAEVKGYDAIPKLNQPKRKRTKSKTPREARVPGDIPPAKDTASPYELIANSPSEGPRTFPLKYGDNTLGRSSTCDVVITDADLWVSRKHAIARVESDQVTLIDLRGKNGTFIQGRKIQTAQLHPGSTFMLGPYFEFTLRKRR